MTLFAKIVLIGEQIISYDKGFIVVVSVLLSILANRLLGLLDYLKDEVIRNKRVRKILPLFAVDLKNAIIHNNYKVAEDSYKLLLRYYDAVGNDDSLSIIFKTLMGHYQFLKNDGYVSNEKRKEDDINEIDNVIATL